MGLSRREFFKLFPGKRREKEQAESSVPIEEGFFETLYEGYSDEVLRQLYASIKRSTEGPKEE